MSFNEVNVKNKIKVKVTFIDLTTNIYADISDVINTSASSTDNIIKINIPLTKRNEIFTGSMKTDSDTGMISEISFIEK